MARHWVRHVMDEATAQWVHELQPANLDTLEISGGKWAQTGFKTYRSLRYPEFDICQGALDETFDLIIAEQVWEHLAYPYRATKHVLQMLRPGGHFLITTPFLIKYHPHPLDCTRWSADGIKYFLEECGFDRSKIKSVQWGNKMCLKANFTGWALYEPQTQSLENEFKYPLVVWALAQRDEA
ncbi:MAG: methyltransferase domain-containing protein [Pseudomonadota bacterium]